jgi:hypothetical protein
VPRWLAHALVVIGWLLTPLLAWGASFLGLWVGAHFATAAAGPFTALAPALVGAAIGGFAVLWGWVRFMRHVPHLLAPHMTSRRSAEPPSGADR